MNANTMKPSGTSSFKGGIGSGAPQNVGVVKQASKKPKSHIPVSRPGKK